MYYPYAMDFWRTHLRIFARGGYNSTLETPHAKLKKMIEAGDCKQFSKSAYNALVKNTNDLAKLWGDNDDCNLMTILFRAFQELDIKDTTIEQIARLLAHDTVDTNFDDLPGLTLSKEIGIMDADFIPLDELDDEDELPPDEFLDPEEKAELKEIIAKKVPTTLEVYHVWRPIDIYNYLNKHVIGQEEAKKAAAMLVYNHVRNRARNIAIAGPTGSGKTEIWRVLSKKFKFIKIIDASSLGAGGWRANMHISDIFKDISKVNAEHLIIVWDEFDKACEPAIGAGGTDHARLLQNEMLKMLDGDTIEFYPDDNKNAKPICINCQNISHVFLGSFETMLNSKTASSGSIGFNSTPKEIATYDNFTSDDLVRYGNVRLEIAGRISRVITLNPMTKDDFLSILSNDKMSPLSAIQEKQKCQLSMDESTREKLAQAALDSKMGARYLRSEIQRRLDEEIFEDPNREEFDLSD